jgi:hypothetical protein
MRLRRLSTKIAALPLWACVGLGACATEAVGVDACRQIEYARCDAASKCPNTFGTIKPATCRRFYRDHCLHGLAVGQDPGIAKVRDCVQAIESLGNCVSTKSEAVNFSECAVSDFYNLSSKTVSACGLLAEPESLSACSFLNPAAASSDAG